MLQPDDLTILQTLKGKNITRNQTQFICKIVTTNYSITTLNLSQIAFGNEEFVNLCQALENNTTITVLDFEWDNIGYLQSEAIQALNQVIQNHITLTSLNLSRNQLTDTHIPKISSSVRFNTIVNTLDLKRNNISNIGAIVLCEDLKVNRTLTYLSLDDNNIIDNSLNDRIKNLLSRNQEFKNQFLEAAEKGNIDNIINLVSIGVSVFSKNEEEMTALHFAAQGGFLPMAQYLVEQCRADIKAKNKKNTSVLELAKRLNQNELINYLTQYLNSIIMCNLRITISFFDQLLCKISYFKDSLEILILTNCDLEIKQLSKLLLILPQLQNLNLLKLDSNKICNIGFERILQYAPRSMRNIFLFYNFVDYVDSADTISTLNNLKSKLHKDIKIHLSGNLIESKKHIHELKNVIKFIFTKFNTTIEKLLDSEFLRYYLNINGQYVLIFKTTTGYEIEATLDFSESEAVNDARKVLGCHTDNEFFNALFRMRYNKTILTEILNLNLFNRETNDKLNVDACKKLLDAHPNAPIKSYLVTNSIFRSHPLSKINCLLLPKLSINLNQGMVYIIARKPINGDILAEHAWLAYEWITKHGQRFFKVANLTIPVNDYWEQFKNFIGKGSSRPVINFFQCEGSVLKTVEYLTNRCIIAGFLTERYSVKKMHEGVLNDIKNFDEVYKTIMLSSHTTNVDDKTKEIVNCIRWAIKKLETHLTVSIPKEVTGIFIPSNVVSNLITIGEPVKLVNHKKPYQT